MTGPGGRDAPSALNAPAVSSRDAPRFGSDARKRALAAAFESQGADYDRLRPGYPDALLDALLAAAPAGARDAVDLGAGTGKLSWQLARRGLRVVAVDPSASMLETALAVGAEQGRAGGGSPSEGAEAGEGSWSVSAGGSVTAHIGTAEATGLGESSADLITVAQAWHWFDAEAAAQECLRILRPGGVLALLWNSLDVQVPWVHRLSRIMHAGDVHREDFEPPMPPVFALESTQSLRWEDPMPTPDLIDLARTRSYVITAAEEKRCRVLANLDWYLHEHLGHAPGSVVGVPYRTELFLYRAAG